VAWAAWISKSNARPTADTWKAGRGNAPAFLLDFEFVAPTSAEMMQRVTVLVAICAAIIAVHVISLSLGGYPQSFGIHPRDVGSAYTILTAPWLHEDFAHLGNNLAIFVVLAALCMLNGLRYFAKASLFIILLSGALVWLFGRSANHIGASGWIFGLWSLTIALAWFDRSYRNIAIAIGVVFFYGGLAFGILPTDSHISFEGHFFGAVSGVLAAFILSAPPKQVTPPAPSPQLKFWG
jgi:membrane associated rhomboid family serine protease